MLMREHGRVLIAKSDGAVWTIGICHRGLDVCRGLVWTDKQVDSAYALDERKILAKCLDSFHPWWGTLSDARQAAIAGMAFDMGFAELHGGFRMALAATRDQHWEHAAVCFLDSPWARSTPGKAGRMARQIATGEWQ